MTSAQTHPHNDVCVQLAAQQQRAVAAHLPPLAPVNSSQADVGWSPAHLELQYLPLLFISLDNITEALPLGTWKFSLLSLWRVSLLPQHQRHQSWWMLACASLLHSPPVPHLVVQWLPGARGAPCSASAEPQPMPLADTTSCTAARRTAPGSAAAAGWLSADEAALAAALVRAAGFGCGCSFGFGCGWIAAGLAALHSVETSHELDAGKL